MRHRFLICDVFTTVRFGGNQLAILPAADGLDDARMQRIAREFNFSETTFVLPSDDRCSRRVRIFTPTTEVPFAGHPNIGTAFALAVDGAFGEIGDGISLRFEEAAGTVPITIRRDPSGLIRCELVAPKPLSLGATIDPVLLAGILGLVPGDIRTATHGPRVAGVGLPFVFTELASRDALERVRIDVAALSKLRDAGMPPDLHVYVRSNDEFDIRARMFSPLDNVPEDPATGSASCALSALLAHHGINKASGGPWRVAQGVEMGRPSVMEVRTGREGDASRTWLSGYCVHVGEGTIRVD